MTGLIGITWSLTLWAPFALISAELARRDERRRRRDRQRLMNDPDEEDAEGEDEGDDRAGIILGIHNVAVSSPQVLATIVCSLVFKLLQKPRNVPGDVSVGWTLRLGGLATLISAFMTWRMKGAGDEDLKK
jgi:solute carrier family 45 protein 1/2/4